MKHIIDELKCTLEKASLDEDNGVPMVNSQGYSYEEYSGKMSDGGICQGKRQVENQFLRIREVRLPDAVIAFLYCRGADSVMRLKILSK